MTIVHFYLLFSAVAVLVLDVFYPIFKESYSWWVVPVLIFVIFITLAILQLLSLLIMILTANLKKEPGKGEKFFRFLVKHSLPIIIGVAKVKIHTKGLEKVQGDDVKLFVCNHQHNFDPAIVYACFPDAKISFIGKKEIIEEKPFFAKAMQRLGGLFLDRDNDREAAKTIVKAIKYLKDGHNSIGLFPEGHRSADDELQPIRNGSLKIATKAKVPVVVCVIDKTKIISKRIFRRTSEIDFRVVDVIYPETFENMTTSELGEIVTSKFREGLDEIRNSVDTNP